jgi:heme-degrading monooxygenase HmoA
MGVVETVSFRLVPGTSEGTFLALDRRVQTELIPNQRGFVRRTTARRGDDWVVVTLWATEADAAAYDAAVAGQAVQIDFDALVEAASVQRQRYDTLD